MPFWIYGPSHAKMCLMPYANNKGADQPVHPRSLNSTSVVRCLDSMICILALSKVSRFWLSSVAEQAGLNLTRSKIPENTLSRDVDHISHKFCSVLVYSAMSHSIPLCSNQFCTLTRMIQSFFYFVSMPTLNNEVEVVLHSRLICYCPFCFITADLLSSSLE